MMLLMALLLRERWRRRQTRYQREQDRDFPLKHDDPLVHRPPLYMAAMPTSLIWIKLIATGFPLNTKRPG
jgi:hypothetical protein